MANQYVNMNAINDTPRTTRNLPSPFLPPGMQGGPYTPPLVGLHTPVPGEPPGTFHQMNYLPPNLSQPYQFDYHQNLRKEEEFQRQQHLAQQQQVSANVPTANATSSTKPTTDATNVSTVFGSNDFSQRKVGN